MKLFIVVSLLIAAAVAVPSIPEFDATQSTAFGYHGKIGIPRAQQIKEYEEELMKDPSRIVGGSAASTGQIPFQAGLLISLIGISGQSVCGAILISNNRLLTAAHCWFDGTYQAYQFQVILGTNLFFFGGTRVTTSSVEMHYEWNPRRIIYDIAMISLNQQVTFTNLIRPVTLPTAFANENFVGWTATASGFGRISDQQQSITTAAYLSYVDLPVITNFVCSLSFGNSVLDSTICTSGAGGKSSCNGDSGGPLFINHNGQDVVIGIVSFGSGQGCEQGWPAAFVRVTEFLDWIDVRM